MELSALTSNFSSPTILFFLLGVLASVLKSDLEIPNTTSKFISLYLLFSIGFKGGQELAHEAFSGEIILALFFGFALALVIPLYSFFILRRKFGVENAGAIAAAYGSVSAVTFVAAGSFLEMEKLHLSGHMIAVMALMEAPSIMAGVMLIRWFGTASEKSMKFGEILKHSMTNGSVLMVLGSLIIGVISDVKQAEGIKPFTTDIFKGFLAIFLLEMGMLTAKRFSGFLKYGWFATAFAIVVPAVNGCLVAFMSSWITDSVANRFLFAILAASASYIAVPAAMRHAAPKADPGLYVPMALGITFPFNITLGFPLYYLIVLNS